MSDYFKKLHSAELMRVLLLVTGKEQSAVDEQRAKELLVGYLHVGKTNYVHAVQEEAASRWQEMMMEIFDCSGMSQGMDLLGQCLYRRFEGETSTRWTPEPWRSFPASLPALEGSEIALTSLDPKAWQFPDKPLPQHFEQAKAYLHSIDAHMLSECVQEMAELVNKYAGNHRAMSKNLGGRSWIQMLHSSVLAMMMQPAADWTLEDTLVKLLFPELKRRVKFYDELLRDVNHAIPVRKFKNLHVYHYISLYLQQMFRIATGQGISPALQPEDFLIPDDYEVNI